MATLVASNAHVGRCKERGCRHATRLERFGVGVCPEHGRYRLQKIWGYEVPNVKCGPRCLNAVGPSCDCSCGGRNHGAGHGMSLCLEV